MNTIIKTTMALVVTTALFTGCSLEDGLEDIGNASSSSSSKSDTFSITKTTLGFNIDWVKKSEGYSEIIYREVGTNNLRGDGYPFTNNYGGSYTLTCEKSSEESDKVGYRCTRSDITLTSSVNLKKGIEYEWLVSYGVDHEHSNPEVYMEYVGDTLTIE